MKFRTITGFAVALAAMLLTTSPVLADGACCDAEAVCTVVADEAACLDESGVYIGDGTTCDPDPCLTGACCNRLTAECTVVADTAACNLVPGAFAGPGTTCVPGACIGACVLPDGSCSEQLIEDCETLGGKFLGPLTTCIEDIPAVSEWGLLVMALLGLAAGTIMFRRARAVAA